MTTTPPAPPPTEPAPDAPETPPDIGTSVAAEEPVDSTVGAEETTPSMAPSTTAMLQVVASTLDQFAIVYGDTVSDGVPAPGAGNLELAGAEDSYTFDASAGDEMILDVLSGRNTTFRWRLEAPDGSSVFDGIYGDRLVVADGGTYTLTVSGAGPTSTGTYSFRVLTVPPAQLFAIGFGDVVSDGVPAAGAGNVEVPGATDVFTFDGMAGQAVVFDHLDGANTSIGWRLQAPDGSELFGGFIGDRDLDLPVAGSYTLTLSGLGIADIGTYSFQLLAAGSTDEFAVAFGDTVSDGVPGAGAGNLETPGSTDVYPFDAVAGQTAIFDWISGNNVAIGWTLTAPDGTVLFDSVLADQQATLPADGGYLLAIQGNGPADVGTYSFRLLSAEAPQGFAIAVGDTVSDGVPLVGAGNLEQPGARDIYEFDGVAGQELDFERLTFGVTSVQWILRDSGGSLVFSGFVTFTAIVVPDTGRYTLEVASTTLDTGTYSFRILDVAGLVDEFTVALGDRVSDGVPDVGAGNLETSSSVDVYRFDAVAGQAAIFDVVLDTDIERWYLDAPDGSTVFDADFDYQDRIELLSQTGTYTLTVVGRNGSGDGTYEFRLLEQTNIDEFSIMLGQLVSDGVPGPGAGNIESPFFVDRYHFDVTAGTVVHFATLSAGTGLRWSLHAPDGSTVFDAGFGNDHVTLDDTGTYTLTVTDQPGAGIPYVGPYSFRLDDVEIDEFTIAYGDTVSDGIPAAGAGNIELGGGSDRYLFDATAGDIAVFDVLDATGNMSWELVGPTDALYFSGGLGDTYRELADSGTYVLTVDGPNAESYSFALLLGSPAQYFRIEVGDTVTDGDPAPGAGNIGGIGERDVYSFAGHAGQVARFDALTGGPALAWTLTAPDGSEIRLFVAFRQPTESHAELFATVFDDIEIVLPADGDYMLTVLDEEFATGTYSFTLTDGSVPPTSTTTEPYVTTTSAEPYVTTTTTTEPYVTTTTSPTTTEPYVTTTTSTTTTTTTTEPYVTTTTEPPVTTLPPVGVLPVDVDVLPRCVRSNGRGVIPVLIYGSADVDLSDLDVTSVALEGMPIITVYGFALAIPLDADGDEFSDLLVLIRNVPGSIPPGPAPVTLSAVLQDGTSIAGSDSVCDML